jgi:CBS domain-containing protein
MNDVLQPPEARRQLEISTVEVVTGRGRSVTLSSVRCPIRARTSPVEECAHCGQSTGIAQDVLSRGEWVCCHARPGAEPPASAWPAVRVALRRTALAVRPGVSAATAVSALRARGEPAAPVVDGEGRPVGWVSEAELLRARPGAKVSHAMTRTALAVAEGAPLSRAAALLVAHGVERVPVVSAEGTIVGVLSALDVVGWLAAPGEQMER